VENEGGGSRWHNPPPASIFFFFFFLHDPVRRAEAWVNGLSLHTAHVETAHVLDQSRGCGGRVRDIARTPQTLGNGRGLGPRVLIWQQESAQRAHVSHAG
jgi:hypothetical protein